MTLFYWTEPASRAWTHLRHSESSSFLNTPNQANVLIDNPRAQLYKE